MRSAISRCFAVTAGIGLLSSSAAAQDTRLTYAELSAALGYSTNPFLRSTNGGGAGFARLSARGVHQWSSETTSTQLIGYWEGSAYTNGYSLSNLVSARAQTTHAVNERLDLTGSAGFSVDFAGELSNRFIYSPEPGQPLTLPVTANPDLFIYNGRQYREDASLGATWKASERSSITGNVGVSHVAFSDSNLRGYTIEFASGKYDHLISERTTAGFELAASRTEFSHSDDVTTIINPAATLSTRLSEDWTVSGAAGVTFATLGHGSQTSHSTDPSFSGTLCHQTANQTLCATASRSASSSAVAELVNSTAVALEWVDRLDSRQTVRLSAGYIHFDRAKVAQQLFTDTEYHAAAGYSRLVSERCSVGANLGLRGLNEPGAGHHTDVSASVFIRYRLGDLG